MYRQVIVHENDRKYQRIFWRQENEIRTFQLNTLTFGVSSSPSTSPSVHKLANDKREEFPDAARVLKTHLYVDDATGANTINEAHKLQDSVIALLYRGDFNIRQWASNDRRIINDLDPDAINSNLELRQEQSLKNVRNILARARQRITLFCPSDQSCRKDYKTDHLLRNSQNFRSGRSYYSRKK